MTVFFPHVTGRFTRLEEITLLAWIHKTSKRQDQGFNKVFLVSRKSSLNVLRTYHVPLTMLWSLPALSRRLTTALCGSYYNPLFNNLKNCDPPLFTSYIAGLNSNSVLLATKSYIFIHCSILLPGPTYIILEKSSSSINTK